MESENRSLLLEGAKAFRVHLTEATLEAFALFLKELVKWNQKINLTAIRTERGVVIKHFLDSLSVCPYLPKASSLLDVGSGPGFPGIPLKLADPSLRIVLLDSVQKKVDFQRHIIRTLGLKGIEAVHGRIQEREILQRMGDRFDRVISRAFADLEVFLRLSGPFLTEGGVAVAMKGGLEEEIGQDLTGGEQVRYRLQETVAFTLPFTSLKRTLLFFEGQ